MALRCCSIGAIMRPLPLDLMAVRFSELGRRCAPCDSRGGFTLIEMLIVAAIIGALAALAIPNYQRAVERARITRAIGDITVIGQAAQEYELDNSMYPPDLAAVGWAGARDPWGQPYQYLRVQGASVGQLRKDGFLVPINSDFDLYSIGPNGTTQPPLNTPASRDDIVRANNGGFVGLAAEY